MPEVSQTTGRRVGLMPDPARLLLVFHIGPARLQDKAFQQNTGELLPAVRPGVSL